MRGHKGRAIAECHNAVPATRLGMQARDTEHTASSPTQNNRCFLIQVPGPPTQTPPKAILLQKRAVEARARGNIARRTIATRYTMSCKTPTPPPADSFFHARGRTLSEFDPGRCRSMSDTSGLNFGRSRAEFGQIWPMPVNFGAMSEDLGRVSATFWPISANLGQLRPTFDSIFPTSAGFGTSRPNSTEFSQTLTDTGPSSADVGQPRVELNHTCLCSSPKPTSAELGKTRPSQLRPEMAQISPRHRPGTSRSGVEINREIHQLLDRNSRRFGRHTHTPYTP